MLANALQVGTVEKLGPYSLGLVPFYHIYGMMLLHLSIYQGKAIVTLPRFQPETFLSTLSNYRVQLPSMLASSDCVVAGIMLANNSGWFRSEPRTLHRRPCSSSRTTLS